MSLRVKYWGVRGSLPSSPTPAQWTEDVENLLRGFFRSGYDQPSQIRDYLRGLSETQIGGFGTATTCAEVYTDTTHVIIDGGSGIRNLSESLFRNPHQRSRTHHHIFLTHFHWDHLIGLPFFAPHFIKNHKVTYYAVQPELEQIVRMMFKRPLFPVDFSSLSAQVQFVALAPRKPYTLGDMTITPYQLDHPDPCWGFRIEHEGKVYSHCVDTEGTRVARESMGPDLPLYQGVDLLYFDAQYTLPELAEKANWGHSAAQIGLDIAFRESVRYIVFAHHDPGASTKQIEELKRQTREYYEWRVKTAETNHVQLPTVKWRYAHEGLEVDLTSI